MSDTEKKKEEEPQKEEETENMNDGKYLELCNQLKELNDKRDITERNLKKKLYEYKHIILSAYGLVRSADEIMNVSHDIPYEAALVIDVARQQLREFVDTAILKIPINEQLFGIDILSEITIQENNIDQ